MDDSIHAIHDLIRRVTAAETALALIKTEWDNLEHNDKMRINDEFPYLAAALVRIPTP